MKQPTLFTLKNLSENYRDHLDLLYSPVVLFASKRNFKKIECSTLEELTDRIKRSSCENDYLYLRTIPAEYIQTLQLCRTASAQVHAIKPYISIILNNNTSRFNAPIWIRPVPLLGTTGFNVEPEKKESTYLAKFHSEELTRELRKLLGKEDPESPDFRREFKRIESENEHTASMLNKSVHSLSHINYLLLAPSGFGKSTIMQCLQYRGLRYLLKTSTRDYRSEEEKLEGEIECVPQSEARFFDDPEYILQKHIFEENVYGIRKDIYLKAINSEKPHIFSFTDIRAALDFRKKFRNTTRLILLNYPLNLAQRGLELRLEESIKKGAKKVVNDSNERLKEILTETRLFSALEKNSLIDKVIKTSNLADATNQIENYIFHENKFVREGLL